MFRHRPSYAARSRRALSSPRSSFRCRKLGFEPLEDRRLLAAIAVSNDNDVVNGDVTSIANLIATPGSDGISLREAIQAANADAAADTISFHPSLHGKQILIGSQLNITRPLTINGPGAHLLTINAGNGADGSFNTGDGFRIFNIDNNSLLDVFSAKLTGLTLTGGDAAGAGGAILSAEHLSISDVVISRNASGGNGGGIVAEGATVIDHTTISENAASVAGGGVFAAGTTSIVNSEILDNTADIRGGGMFVEGTTTIISSTIAGNSSPTGGGIAANGTLTVRDSTLSGNRASISGGGMVVYDTATITSSTISENRANVSGGGVWADINAGNTLVIRHSTIFGNNADEDGNGVGRGGGLFLDTGAGSVTLENTIVAGNRDKSNTSRDLDNMSAGGNPTLNAKFNFIGDGTLSGVMNNVMGNQVGTKLVPKDPKLFPLAENGGPTKTHLPKPESPVIDRGDPAAFAGIDPVPLYEQRGAPFVRVQDGPDDMPMVVVPRIDIGATEAEDPNNGPRVVDLFVTYNDDYPVFDPKPSIDGPTPLVHSLTIRVQDLLPIVATLPGDYNDDGIVNAADYLVWKNNKGTTNVLPNDPIGGMIDNDQYNQWIANFGKKAEPIVIPAVNVAIAANKSRYQLVGDFTGIVANFSVQVILRPAVIGQPSEAEIRLLFDRPLKDDRYTLTVSDAIRDSMGNALDGDSDAAEPLAPPTFPSGDGFAGGNFVARFTVDSRPEIGSTIAPNIDIDTNGNGTWDAGGGQIGGDVTNIDLRFRLPVVKNGIPDKGGFGVSDQLFSGKFVNTLLGVPPSTRLFDQLAAYGNSTELGGYRWIIDTNSDGVVSLETDILKMQPALSGALINIAGAIPVAGNFNTDNPGDEIGLYNAGKWALDTNANFVIDPDDTFITGTLLGYPVVGDFDGDGRDDLATFNNNTWYFDLAIDGLGVSNTDAANSDMVGSDRDQSLAWGFPGPLERPLAADMDQDGIDDIGLRVPATSSALASWQFLVSGTRTATIAEGATTTQFTAPRLIGAPIAIGDLVRIKLSGDRIVTGVVDQFDFLTGKITLKNALSDPPAVGSIVSVGGSEGTIVTLAHGFSPAPIGNDIAIDFGGLSSLPVVGNFDPPVAAGGGGAAASSNEFNAVAADFEGESAPALSSTAMGGSFLLELPRKPALRAVAEPKSRHFGSTIRRDSIKSAITDSALADLRLMLLPRAWQAADSDSIESIATEIEDCLRSADNEQTLPVELAWDELSQRGRNLR